MAETPISKRGTKLLSNSISRNNVPAEYLSISKNARIIDGTITKRRGQATRATFESISGEIQGITYNKKLLVVMGGHLYSINTTTRDETDIGSIGTTDIVNFINYGKYTIILTGNNAPRIFDGESLIQNDIWNPAYLKGTATLTVPLDLSNWLAITNGEFAITIDGIARNITGLNFTGAGSYAGIATIIQTAIRASTGKLETVEWTYESGTAMIGRLTIKSVNTTSATAISKGRKVVGGVGTDISGETLTNIYNLHIYDGIVTDGSPSTFPQCSPIIGDSFAGFTFIAGNTTTTNNILYISEPITLAKPENAFDWVGSGSEQITFDKPILGIKSTMNKLFIFTENKVEYIGKDSLTVVGGVASLISTPIGDGGALASYRGIVSASDKVFYLTNKNTINTVNYAEGTVEPEIAVLTDEVSFRITKFLQNLDEDQTGTYSYYNDEEKTMFWFLKTRDSLYNDIVLMYDLGNKTRGTDTNKYYNGVAFAGNKLYAGSSINNSITEVDIGNDDDNTPIEFEIQDTDVMLGTTREKIFNGRQTSGSLNLVTNLEINTLVDDNIVCLKYIKGIDYVTSINTIETGGIGDSEIGGDALAGSQSNVAEELSYFDKTLDHGNIWRRGTRIKRNIKENTLGSKFYLDWYVIFANPTGNIELSDLF